MPISATLRKGHCFFSPISVQIRGFIAQTSSLSLSLSLQSLANKHREVNEGHVVALLAMRGDMSKAQVTKVGVVSRALGGG